MKLNEFCEELNRSEATILKNWERTKQTLEKQGIIITKIGKGRSAQYYVEYIGKESK